MFLFILISIVIISFSFGYYLYRMYFEILDYLKYKGLIK